MIGYSRSHHTGASSVTSGLGTMLRWRLRLRSSQRQNTNDASVNDRLIDANIHRSEDTLRFPDSLTLKKGVPMTVCCILSVIGRKGESR